MKQPIAISISIAVAGGMFLACNRVSEESRVADQREDVRSGDAPQDTIEDVPVTCSLDAAHLEERRRLLQALTHDVNLRRELDDGFAFRFDAKPGIVTRLARLVELERACCKFLAFRIVAGQSDGPVWLEIRGPAGTKQMIDDVFSGK